MRLTCLKCGHQIELATAPEGIRLSCTCGQEHSYPEVHNTGIRPNARAAERSRSRAFRAAGLVKNIGGFALGLSLLGIIFFPFGLVGAALGLYVLTMLRGPVGRYSGRRSALAALGLGAAVSALGPALTLSWIDGHRRAHLVSLQQGAADDLRALLRAQRLFRASNDTYGSFKEFRFLPQHGQYTIYLGADDFLPARRDGQTVVDPLPAELQPMVAESSFTAVAVGNIDDDPDLDIWVLTDDGRPEHVRSDVAADE